MDEKISPLLSSGQVIPYPTPFSLSKSLRVPAELKNFMTNHDLTFCYASSEAYERCLVLFALEIHRSALGAHFRDVIMAGGHKIYDGNILDDLEDAEDFNEDFVFILLQQKKVIGCCYIRKIKDISAYTLESMEMDSAYCNKGLGQVLLASVINFCLTRGKGHATIDLISTKAGLYFYYSLGFIVGRAGYPAPDKVKNALWKDIPIGYRNGNTENSLPLLSFDSKYVHSMACYQSKMRNKFSEELTVLNKMKNYVKVKDWKGAEQLAKNTSGGFRYGTVHLLAFYGQTDELSLYLMYFPDHKDLQDATGRTPLFLAAREDHVETVSFLLAKGANLALCKNNRIKVCEIAGPNVTKYLQELEQKQVLQQQTVMVKAQMSKKRKTDTPPSASSSFNVKKLKLYDFFPALEEHDKKEENKKLEEKQKIIELLNFFDKAPLPGVPKKVVNISADVPEAQWDEDDCQMLYTPTNLLSQHH